VKYYIAATHDPAIRHRPLTMAMLINGFSDLSFQRAGVFSGNLTCGSLSVHARLDVDVRGLFPYIKFSSRRRRFNSLSG
jgi:hypothetical protein